MRTSEVVPSNDLKTTDSYSKSMGMNRTQNQYKANQRLPVLLAIVVILKALLIFFFLIIINTTCSL